MKQKNIILLICILANALFLPMIHAVDSTSQNSARNIAIFGLCAGIGATISYYFLKSWYRNDAPQHHIAEQNMLPNNARGNSPANNNALVHLQRSTSQSRRRSRLESATVRIRKKNQQNINNLLIEGARQNNDAEVYSALRARADIAARDQTRKTALMYAAEQGNAVNVGLIIEAALKRGRIEQFSSFFSQPFPSFLNLTRDEETALSMAASEGHLDVVEALYWAYPTLEPNVIYKAAINNKPRVVSYFLGQAIDQRGAVAKLRRLNQQRYSQAVEQEISAAEKREAYWLQRYAT